MAAVVLNWCQHDTTAACLRSLRRVGHEPFRVVLVDNGSTDGSGERLRRGFPEVEYVANERNMGYAGGGNRGFERGLELGADYLLLLNNDTELAPGAVERLVRTAEAAPDIGGVTPKILYDEDRSRIWYGGGRVDYLRGLGMHLRQGERDGRAGHGRNGTREEGSEEVTFLTGCCMLLRADALRRVGGMAEEYFIYVEDAELSHRIRKGGYRLLYEPRARLYHQEPLPPTDPRPLQIYLRDRNRRMFARSAMGPLLRLRFLLWFYPTRAARWLQYLARGDRARARAILRGMGIPGRLPEGAPR